MGHCFTIQDGSNGPESEQQQFGFAEKVKNIWENYEERDVLGKGGSCRVLRVKDKRDGREYAMKEMKRDDEWNPILFKQEYSFLTTLKEYPYVIQFYIISHFFS